METKYFHAENAGRNLAGTRFNIYSQSAGTLWGVYATDVQSEISALSSMSASPSSGVTSISKDEYDGCLKKKNTTSDDLPHLNKVWPPAAPIKGTTAATVVYDTKPVEDKTEIASSDKPLESVDAAIKVEIINGRNP